MSNPYSAPDAVLSEPGSGDNTYEPKVFSIHGRIGRLRYLAYSWGLMMLLWAAFGAIAAIVIPSLARNGGNPGAGVLIVAYIPGIAIALIMAKRRLNDLDKSGWLGLLFLVPLVNFFFGLYLMFGAGTDGPNTYGPKPQKNSALLWIGGLFMPFAIVGILAAVAIPAYQQYKARAQALQTQQAPQNPQAPQPQ